MHELLTFCHISGVNIFPTQKAFDNVSTFKAAWKGKRKGRQKGGGKLAKECRMMLHYMAYLFSNKKDTKVHFSGWKNMNRNFFSLTGLRNSLPDRL